MTKHTDLDPTQKTMTKHTDLEDVPTLILELEQVHRAIYRADSQILSLEGALARMRAKQIRRQREFARQSARKAESRKLKAKSENGNHNP
jgi:hypothetical protein